MPRDLDHFELPRRRGELPRRLAGGGQPVPRGNKREHADALLGEAEDVARSTAAQTVDASLIFRIELHEDGSLTDALIERMNLRVIAREPDRTIVVFSSDHELREFARRLSAYGGLQPGPAYGEMSSVEHLRPIAPEDRIGARLAAEPFDPEEENISIDVELWHPGNARTAADALERVSSEVTASGGRVTDSIISPDLVVARVRTGAASVARLLELTEIREVDRTPRTGITSGPRPRLAIEDMPQVDPPEEGAAGVLVMDSGITANHPLLRDLVGDAAAFPGPNEPMPDVVDEDEDGHGTCVSSIAALGDVEHAIGQGSVRGVRLFSARVLNADAEYDPDVLVEHQLEKAIRHFIDAYPECKVINLSLNDKYAVFADGRAQFRIAARIDELAFELQDRNILFVISTGNSNYFPNTPTDRRRLYPDYLRYPSARISEPATAAIALTVGGLSLGTEPADDTRSAVAGRTGFPSPFTRSGPGVGGMIKPEFVAPAGDHIVDETGRLLENDEAGVLTADRDFAPPAGDLVKRMLGTSFSAPKVANLAARLFDEFPNATPNLVRALLAESADLPSDRPVGLRGEPWEDDTFAVYGYGEPSLSRAAKSAENDVVLMTESEIGLDSFAVFEIPELPEDFIEKPGRRTMCVSLAFDPPTRRTRADNYLGVTMGFEMFRNIELGALESIYRNWSAAPAGSGEHRLEASLTALPGRQRVRLRPGSNTRKLGTLHHARMDFSTRAWNYEGGPLYIAVTSKRNWAPAEVRRQRFALVASIKHSDPEVQLHARLRERLQTRVRIQT